jgi:hypothetical protein
MDHVQAEVPLEQLEVSIAVKTRVSVSINKPEPLRSEGDAQTKADGSRVAPGLRNTKPNEPGVNYCVEASPVNNLLFVKLNRKLDGEAADNDNTCRIPD